MADLTQAVTHCAQIALNPTNGREWKSHSKLSTGENDAGEPKKGVMAVELAARSPCEPYSVEPIDSESSLRDFNFFHFKLCFVSDGTDEETFFAENIIGS